jgi:hypothetical protein
MPAETEPLAFRMPLTVTVICCASRSQCRTEQRCGAAPVQQPASAQIKAVEMTVTDVGQSAVAFGGRTEIGRKR